MQYWFSLIIKMSDDYFSDPPICFFQDQEQSLEIEGFWPLTTPLSNSIDDVSHIDTCSVNETESSTPTELLSRPSKACSSRERRNYLRDLMNIVMDDQIRQEVANLYKKPKLNLNTETFGLMVWVLSNQGANVKQLLKTAYETQYAPKQKRQDPKSVTARLHLFAKLMKTVDKILSQSEEEAAKVNFRQCRFKTTKKV